MKRTRPEPEGFTAMQRETLVRKSANKANVYALLDHAAAAPAFSPGAFAVLKKYLNNRNFKLAPASNATPYAERLDVFALLDVAVFVSLSELVEKLVKYIRMAFLQFGLPWFARAPPPLSPVPVPVPATAPATPPQLPPVLEEEDAFLFDVDPDFVFPDNDDDDVDANLTSGDAVVDSSSHSPSLRLSDDDALDAALAPFTFLDDDDDDGLDPARTLFAPDDADADASWFHARALGLRLPSEAAVAQRAADADTGAAPFNYLFPALLEDGDYALSNEARAAIFGRDFLRQFFSHLPHVTGLLEAWYNVLLTLPVIATRPFFRAIAHGRVSEATAVALYSTAAPHFTRATLTTLLAWANTLVPRAAQLRTVLETALRAFGDEVPPPPIAPAAPAVVVSGADPLRQAVQEAAWGRCLWLLTEGGVDPWPPGAAKESFFDLVTGGTLPSELIPTALCAVKARAHKRFIARWLASSFALNPALSSAFPLQSTIVGLNLRALSNAEMLEDATRLVEDGGTPAALALYLYDRAFFSLHGNERVTHLIDAAPLVRAVCALPDPETCAAFLAEVLHLQWPNLEPLLHERAPMARLLANLGPADLHEGTGLWPRLVRKMRRKWRRGVALLILECTSKHMAVPLLGFLCTLSVNDHLVLDDALARKVQQTFGAAALLELRNAIHAR